MCTEMCFGKVHPKLLHRIMSRCLDINSQSCLACLDTYIVSTHVYQGLSHILQNKKLYSYILKISKEIFISTCVTSSYCNMSARNKWIPNIDIWFHLNCKTNWVQHTNDYLFSPRLLLNLKYLHHCQVGAGSSKENTLININPVFI
jgi:hypothetical protein